MLDVHKTWTQSILSLIYIQIQINTRTQNYQLHFGIRQTLEANFPYAADHCGGLESVGYKNIHLLKHCEPTVYVRIS